MTLPPFYVIRTLQHRTSTCRIVFAARLEQRPIAGRGED